MHYERRKQEDDRDEIPSVAGADRKTHIASTLQCFYSKAKGTTSAIPDSIPRIGSSSWNSSTPSTRREKLKSLRFQEDRLVQEKTFHSTKKKTSSPFPTKVPSALGMEAIDRLFKAAPENITDIEREVFAEKGLADSESLILVALHEKPSCLQPRDCHTQRNA